MNYEGQPCKNCGIIIQIYSTSGFCRRCWYERRTGKSRQLSKVKLSQEERLARLLEKHAKGDLTRYRMLSIDGVQVPEHRYVVEKTLGKPIPPGWVVHHLNALKGDNRPGNLSALPRSDHDSKQLVNELKKRIGELEEIVNGLNSNRL